jgi:penicillin amidase
MRFIFFILSSFITLGLIIALNYKWGSVPPMGKFLSPQQGFWQNAEPVDFNYNEQLRFKNLKGRASVYLDGRLVPHIFADKEEDAFFVQGYLHAKFRLWQMDFQTRAAAGRISELLGNDPRFIRFDREQRRLGMVYGAENALKAMEADGDTKKVIDAYTAGVNAFITTLTGSKMPLEYKLLDYEPELWSNLKVALFLKQMSKTLAGFERDLEYTNIHAVFPEKEMKILFPQVSDSSIPIIPKGTVFPQSITPAPPQTVDSLYLNNDTTLTVKEVNKPDRNNGSNNWAVSGKKTKSGAPILCNDPHLELTFPSIWYEMQISTPSYNVYGATFPGAPSVIIGFNDSIAFGVTNAQRDVKDYYKIRFKDATKKEYWFKGKWQPTKIRIEQIKVKNAFPVIDTVAYTLFGPVMYDESFTPDVSGHNAIAVRWIAHDSSNELATFLKLNRSKNYKDYAEAISSYGCPGQNFAFASKSGDIAIWQQGKFPARWDRQGLYIMPGADSSYLWKGYIPQQENPHVLNPESGFVQSANQRPADADYPYFIPGNYISARGITIYNRLKQMQQITPKDMMALQNDYYSSLAADAIPLFLKYINENELNETESVYLTEIKKWDFYVTPGSRAATIYQSWMDSLKSVVWNDDFSRVKDYSLIKERPDEQTLVEALLRDPAFKYLDNINTPQTETINQQITEAFKRAASALQKEEKVNGLVWWKHKNPSIFHLLRTSVLPFARTGIQVGGWGNTINAVKVSYGPSWRMIVHLTTPTEAYGVYPGGQNGNPGSRFYDSFVDAWATGKYYTLWVMKKEETTDKHIKWKMTFSNA